MTNPRLANRYAKSLIDLATELNQLDVVYADMKWLQDIGKSNPDFIAVLQSPVIQPAIKGKILTPIVTGQISDTTISFIRLLVRKGRENNLLEITESFVEQFNALREIYKVKFTSAMPVGEDVKEIIIAKVKSSTHRQNIELETVVDEELIGGFLLQMQDRLIDASIQRDLREIQLQFMDNEYIQKIR